MRDPTAFLEKEYNDLVEKALDWRLNIRNKSRREVLAKRFKDPASP